MTPAEWNVVMAPDKPWKIAYGRLEVEARLFLETERPRGMATTQLMEYLYPAAAVRGEEAMAARSRMFRGLAALAKHQMADCAVKGPGVVRYGVTAYPWLWNAPPAPVVAEVCPCCKRPL